MWVEAPRQRRPRSHAGSGPSLGVTWRRTAYAGRVEPAQRVKGAARRMRGALSTHAVVKAPQCGARATRCVTYAPPRGRQGGLRALFALNPPCVPPPRPIPPLRCRRWPAPLTPPAKPTRPLTGHRLASRVSARSRTPAPRGRSSAPVVAGPAGRAAATREPADRRVAASRPRAAATRRAAATHQPADRPVAVARRAPATRLAAAAVAVPADHEPTPRAPSLPAPFPGVPAGPAEPAPCAARAASPPGGPVVPATPAKSGARAAPDPALHRPAPRAAPRRAAATRPRVRPRLPP